MRLPRIVEPLRHRDFRLLWTGQTVSVFGDFVHNVALPFQILALGGGPLELGLWGAIFSGATLVFSLLGGAIADRFPRRSVILASDLVSGAIVGAIAPLLRQVREGLAYAFSVPWLWIFIFAWAIVLLGMVGPLGVAMPILVRDVLRGDARLYGLITAAIGVGEVVTSIVLAQVRIRRLGIAICLFAILGGLSIAGIGLVPAAGATMVFAAG